MGKCTRTEQNQLHFQLKTRRLHMVSPPPQNPALNSSTSGRLLAASLNKFSSNSVDLEEDDENVITVEAHAITASDFGDRREKTTSDDVESIKKKSRRTTVAKMPSGDELEEFFAVAEKSFQKQFTEKYNFDVVKEEPLEGRYEWVQIQD